MRENFLKSICYPQEIQLELKFCQVWGKKENDVLDLYNNENALTPTPLQFLLENFIFLVFCNNHHNHKCRVDKIL